MIYFFDVEKCKNLKETFDLINIVLELIKRVGKEDNDTIFMNNIELLEYLYKINNTIIKNIENNLK